MNNKKYWESFYKKQRNNIVPTSFAEYVLQKYLQPGKNLLELGCGNGRDAFFFASEKNILVSAIDQAEQEINYLKSISNHNPSFIAQDFTDLSSINKVDYVYSRFTLHSITKKNEDLLFSQLFDVMNDKGLFLMEARSKKDEDQAKFFAAKHYRRYLDFDETYRKIEKLGFKILEKVEGQNMAVYKDENPYVLRIIAQKSGK